MKSATPRMGNALNQALHDLFAARPDLLLLGEDIADPYGGAFGITRGLSTRYPGRVIGTPISEQAIAGMAAGLALTGDQVIIEIMFGDFIGLCFDQILNFLTKSVSMYGRLLPMRVVIRCPVGGNRGYGPTHSQSPQKHFIGVPHLSLYELSPLHAPVTVLNQILDSAEPAIFFEDKVLYTQPPFGCDPSDTIFRCTRIGGRADWAVLDLEGAGPEWAIVAPGGLSRRVLAAMRQALIENETGCRMLTPSRLFPLDLQPVLPLLDAAERILVVEDGLAGGGWACEIARDIHERLWGRLRHPVRLLQPPCRVIPAAPHLERQLSIQESTVYRALTGAHDE